jgi:hypothetical protein
MFSTDLSIFLFDFIWNNKITCGGNFHRRK